jgi:serine/threonine protein kinase
MGTVNYMSPEQARGREVDARSDIFALGSVIYEMATGQRAFSGETSTDVVVSILEKEPAPLSRLAPEAPAELQRIVAKALRKDRGERYQTTRDLLLDLKNLKEEIAFDERLVRSRGRETADEPAKTANLKKRRLAAGASGIALIIALSIAGALLWSRQQSATAPPTGTAAPPERSLSYWVAVQKYRDGRPYQEPFRLRDDINFERDYQIRLNISSPQSGYLYLLNEAPELNGKPPSFVVMFPSTTTNQLSARINENEQIQIPEKSWFRFDDQEGTEKIWLVWADQRVDELEAVKGYTNPGEKGLIEDATRSARLHEFLKSHNSSGISVERDENRTETALRASGNMLVHVIKLSHH